MKRSEDGSVGEGKVMEEKGERLRTGTRTIAATDRYRRKSLGDT